MTTAMTTAMPLPEFDYIVDWSAGVPIRYPQALEALTELADSRDTIVRVGVRLPAGREFFGLFRESGGA